VQYMLMCCFDEKRWEELPEGQRARIMEEYGEWERGLASSGQYRVGAKLQPTATSATVRVKNGKPVATDGPFAETKEQLGGYHVLECKDLDEAISIAMRIPTLPAGGVVEVRPVEFPTQT
jgi:hypothetical protein